ncbi:MAG: imidazole glycerol phosphate synthase, glutamine amidotransferase subunit [Bacteroidales bacterium 45-6]|mgnify:CR=1 FL=1|nr:MAG: imidazole glycerol phosphate synthase, glutamine amidotransferase subunit [Bacteroidales bacterium 45-6]
MEVAVVKYNAGNIFSVMSALQRLGIDATLTDDKDVLRKADKIIFPGQGEAGNTMAYLHQHGLAQLIKDLKQPLLGICIGMQLMCAHSEEGNTPCLGIFDVPVVKFRPLPNGEKIPHMGWNSIREVKSPIFDASLEDEYVYFVHSYYVPLTERTAAVTDYVQPFSSALQKDNFYATQFHPEKSGSVGERILTNFLNL